MTSAELHVLKPSDHGLSRQQARHCWRHYNLHLSWLQCLHCAQFSLIRIGVLVLILLLNYTSHRKKSRYRRTEIEARLKSRRRGREKNILCCYRYTCVCVYKCAFGDYSILFGFLSIPTIKSNQAEWFEYLKSNNICLTASHHQGNKQPRAMFFAWWVLKQTSKLTI